MDKTYFGVHIGDYLLNTNDDRIYLIIGPIYHSYLNIKDIVTDSNEHLCIDECCYDSINQTGRKEKRTGEFIGFKTIEQIDKYRTFK